MEKQIETKNNGGYFLISGLCINGDIKHWFAMLAKTQF